MQLLIRFLFMVVSHTQCAFFRAEKSRARAGISEKGTVQLLVRMIIVGMTHILHSPSRMRSTEDKGRHKEEGHIALTDAIPRCRYDADTVYPVEEENIDEEGEAYAKRAPVQPPINPPYKTALDARTGGAYTEKQVGSGTSGSLDSVEAALDVMHRKK